MEHLQRPYNKQGDTVPTSRRNTVMVVDTDYMEVELAAT